jgi:hypothetical protein
MDTGMKMAEGKKEEGKPNSGNQMIIKKKVTPVNLTIKKKK